MKFNRHKEFEGSHAFLGASNYHWINYDEEKLRAMYESFFAAQRGTRLHEFAAECIRLKQKLPKSKTTLNMYVNDAIGFRLTPEQVLYYSPNCFGTTDAIGFSNNTLRIHDLKTGTGPTHMEQLEVYAAIFCLEYRMDPHDIAMELRIYQLDEVMIEAPDPDIIAAIMQKIELFDKEIMSMKEEE